MDVLEHKKKKDCASTKKAIFTLTDHISISFEVMLPSAYSFIVYCIKLHADGNITSKLIEQYSAAEC
jgi:hypothetical protein